MGVTLRFANAVLNCCKPARMPLEPVISKSPLIGANWLDAVWLDEDCDEAARTSASERESPVDVRAIKSVPEPEPERSMGKMVARIPAYPGVEELETLFSSVPSARLNTCSAVEAVWRDEKRVAMAYEAAFATIAPLIEALEI